MSDDDEVTCISVSVKNGDKNKNNQTSLDQSQIKDTDLILDEIVKSSDFKIKTFEANDRGIQDLLAKANKDSELLRTLEQAILKQDEEIGAKIDRLTQLEKELETARVRQVVKPKNGKILKPARYDRQIENLYKRYVLSDSSSSDSDDNSEMIEKAKSNFKDSKQMQTEENNDKMLASSQDSQEEQKQNSKLLNPYQPERRKLPENPTLLAKIPDEIIRYIQNSHHPLEPIPVIYRRYDDDREPWLHGSITSCRSRYGQETMLVTDESTQTIISVPYDSIAIDTKKQPKLVQSLSHCQRIRNNDLEAEDQADNAIIPIFRTHRVYLKNECKSAWIVNKIDDHYFYVVCDDVYIGKKGLKEIKAAQAKAKRETKTRVDFALNKPCQSMEDQIDKRNLPQFTEQEMFAFESINGVFKVRFDEIAPIMGQLFYYDDYENNAIKMFIEHFPHLLKAPTMLHRIRQFDSQFNDSRKQSRWQHWFDTIYSLLVNTVEETKEEIVQYYDKLNLEVGDKLELRCGSKVEVIEVDEVFHFFKVRVENDKNLTEWLHPTSLILTTHRVDKW